MSGSARVPRSDAAAALGCLLLLGFTFGVIVGFALGVIVG